MPPSCLTPVPLRSVSVVAASPACSSTPVPCGVRSALVLMCHSPPSPDYWLAGSWLYIGTSRLQLGQPAHSTPCGIYRPNSPLSHQFWAGSLGSGRFWSHFRSISWTIKIHCAGSSHLLEFGSHVRLIFWIIYSRSIALSVWFEPKTCYIEWLIDLRLDHDYDTLTLWSASYLDSDLITVLSIFIAQRTQYLQFRIDYSSVRDYTGILFHQQWLACK